MHCTAEALPKYFGAPCFANRPPSIKLHASVLPGTPWQLRFRSCWLGLALPRCNLNSPAVNICLNKLWSRGEPKSSLVDPRSKLKIPKEIVWISLKLLDVPPLQWFANTTLICFGSSLTSPVASLDSNEESGRREEINGAVARVSRAIAFYFPIIH
jgi:hypothetical protein